MNSIILLAGTRLLVALLLVFSIFMLLRGHNTPGGGFIGGLIGATGFVVYAIACGTEQARLALRVPPENVAMVGLGIALFAGVMAIFFGDAFFTGQWLFIGATEDDKGLPLSSVLVFDIGVYMVVMGSILTLTFALEEGV
ncbi:MAG: Na+/H+ antiporter subunit B [Rhodobacteraceae bacterium]|nr:Na+/H+ antiporter subunit B [Alphaproteobacteria bacterium]MBT8475902.1 Na+/H+ antiporter subunit B [Alphaproteobacteria bacterium]NNF72405.1 Na+/H+ antiporter subunit B [Paracoccaceae bacterium]NNK65845.1 Na+/H+ antiporter subunit B [Paracoccaceae bacterium]